MASLAPAAHQFKAYFVPEVSNASFRETRKGGVAKLTSLLVSSADGGIVLKA